MKKSMSSVLDRIYRLVKEYKRVDVVLFCDKLDLSPSTFYNYRKFIIARYVNIEYQNGVLVWIDTEEVTESGTTETNLVEAKM